jgi:Rieske 2Fe-2S family protein
VVETTIQELVSTRRKGWTLPQVFYTDPEIFEADLEKVFRRYWLMIGHASRIPKPGDWFVYRLAQDSYIIVRGKDGVVRALPNSCTHRGSAICITPEGHGAQLVCPYHQWVFDLDGTLKAARLMPPEFDKSPFGLKPAHCRVVQGCIFLSLAESPPDFEPVARDLQDILAAHELDRTKVAFSREYEIKANWKLIFENFRECYHCDGNHPELVNTIPWLSLHLSKERQAELDALNDSKRQHWERIGLSVGGTAMTRQVCHLSYRFVMREGFVSASMDGKPVAPLLGRLKDPDAGGVTIQMYPNCLVLDGCSDHFVASYITPVSPTLCHARVDWLVREDAVEGKDYQIDRLTKLYSITAQQDWTLCENNHAGVSSRAYRPGPYAPSEGNTELFVEWYLDQLTDK